MIDKSIPYYNVLMRYDGPAVSEKPVAPKGYRFRGYRDGDEYAWARMEVDNKDFDTFDNAVTYFRSKYCGTPEKLQERFVGLENSSGELCGIVICWDDQRGTDLVSSVHWLVTDPKEQGKGIGGALVGMLLYRFSRMNALPIYLHTQPWSYVAIGIYSKAGFRLLKQDSFRGYENQTEHALPVLQKIMRPDLYKKLIEEMI